MSGPPTGDRAVAQTRSERLGNGSESTCHHGRLALHHGGGAHQTEASLSRADGHGPGRGHAVGGGPRRKPSRAVKAAKTTAQISRVTATHRRIHNRIV